MVSIIRSFLTAFSALEPVYYKNTGSSGRSEDVKTGRCASYRCTTPDIERQISKQFPNHSSSPSSKFEKLVYEYNIGYKTEIAKKAIKYQLSNNSKPLKHLTGKVLYRGTGMNLALKMPDGSLSPYADFISHVVSYGSLELRRNIGRKIMLTEEICANSTGNFGITSASTRPSVSRSYAKNTALAKTMDEVMIVLKLDKDRVPRGYMPRFNGYVMVDGKKTFKDEILLDPNDIFELTSFTPYSKKHKMAKIEILVSSPQR